MDEEYQTSILATELPYIELVFPDTASKSKGFMLRATGFTKTSTDYPNLSFISDKSARNLTLTSDSIFVSVKTLADLPEGKLLIRLTDYVQRNTEIAAGDRTVVRYNIYADKQVYLTK